MAKKTKRVVIEYSNKDQVLQSLLNEEITTEQAREIIKELDSAKVEPSPANPKLSLKEILVAMQNGELTIDQTITEIKALNMPNKQDKLEMAGFVHDAKKGYSVATRQSTEIYDDARKSGNLNKGKNISGYTHVIDPSKPTR